MRIFWLIVCLVAVLISSIRAKSLRGGSQIECIQIDNVKVRKLLNFDVFLKDFIIILIYFVQHAQNLDSSSREHARLACIYPNGEYFFVTKEKKSSDLLEKLLNTETRKNVRIRRPSRIPFRIG